MPYTCIQTLRKLFMLYQTENQFFTTFSNFKHGYIKKFIAGSSHIFHWSSHFFIGRGPKTDKFCGVCIHVSLCHPMCYHWFRFIVACFPIDTKPLPKPKIWHGTEERRQQNFWPARVSVLPKLFMAPVQMPILRTFGQVTHTIPIWWQIFLPIRSMILPVWDGWMGG